MDTLSMSNTMSKGSVYESDSIYKAYLDDAESRLADGVRPKAISNEEIHKGDEILQIYRVEDDAIHGGMGSVWRVRHMGWNADLAMKRPQPRFFSEGSDRRKAEFVAECEHWINLGLHPNIVSCYYVREIGGVPTVFSEWMDGGSLKDAIQSGRLYEGAEAEVQERILDIAIQAARGLLYSHEQGLIHQDVKPGNILLTKDWNAKVVDFGLAKAQSQLSDGEKPESSGYTLAYCPREQAEGERAEVWMDVYAWALTVAEMYAGQRSWNRGQEVRGRLAEILKDGRIAVPNGMRNLLDDVVKRVFSGFARVQERLEQIYGKVCGAPYDRPDPTTAADTADSLNDRALSFLDLGKPDEAERLWQSALQSNAGHENSIFNLALCRWRHAQIDLEEAVDQLSGIQDEIQRQRLEQLMRAEGTGTVRLHVGAGDVDLASAWAAEFYNDKRTMYAKADRHTMEMHMYAQPQLVKTSPECVAIVLYSGTTGRALFMRFLEEDRFLLIIFGRQREGTPWFSDDINEFVFCVWETDSGRLVQRGLLRDHPEWEYSYDQRADTFLLRADPDAMGYLPGERASYRQSFVQSTRTRLATDQEYRRLMAQSAEAGERGHVDEALRMAARAGALSGYEGNPEPIELRNRLGNGLTKTGIRRILATRAADRPAKRVEPQIDEASLKPFSVVMDRLRRELVGSDPYSEYKVTVKPVEFSRDGRYLLLYTMVNEERDSPADFDIEMIDTEGAAVIDTRSGGIVFRNDRLFRKSNYENPYAPMPNVGVIMHLDHSGRYLMVTYTELWVFDLSSGSALTGQTVGQFLCAFFLEDDRFMLGASADQSVRILRSPDCGVVTTYRFPQVVYDNVYPVDDNHFAVTSNTGDSYLCTIDWQYEAEEADDPEAVGHAEAPMRSAENASPSGDAPERQVDAASVSADSSWDSSFSGPEEIGSLAWDDDIGSGDVLSGNYELTGDEIFGGMSRVWPARRIDTGEACAVIRPLKCDGDAGNAAWRRFADAHALWAGLERHSNVVACLESREIDGVPTAVCEWIDGPNLTQAIRDGSLYVGTPDEVRRRVFDIAAEAASALRFVHEAGLVHGDVKPANLLLGCDDTVKLNDFGLARRFQAKDDPTEEPTPGYTLAYCPKEQAEGKPTKPWMDVYAWTLTVLEMYLGERPWRSGVEAAQGFDEYVSACRVTPPEGMVTLLRSCLKWKVNDGSVVVRELDRMKQASASESTVTASDAAQEAPKPGIGGPAPLEAPHPVEQKNGEVRESETRSRGLGSFLGRLFFGKRGQCRKGRHDLDGCVCRNCGLERHDFKFIKETVAQEPGPCCWSSNDDCIGPDCGTPCDAYYPGREGKTIRTWRCARCGREKVEK